MLTFHHIVIDGWSLPILLQEIFTGYFGQRMPAAVPYRSFVGWLAGQDREAARAAWREVLDGFEAPTLVAPLGLRPGPRGVQSHRLSAETTRGLGELARSCRTTVSTVLQAGWAQVLMMATGQQDVAFGTAVSGRPGGVGRCGLDHRVVDQHGAGAGEHDRGEHRRRPAGSAATLHNNTVEHEHLALAEIHRLTGHDQFFDTLLVLENYPVDTARVHGRDALAITDSPAASTTTTRCPSSPRRARNWACGSNSTPTPSTETGSRPFRPVREGVGGDDRRYGPAAVVAGLLDEDEQDELDEWGNRAALGRPVGGGVDSGVVRRQVARAPDGGDPFRWPLVVLWGAGCGLESVGASVVWSGVGPGECVAVLLPRWAEASWRSWRS